MLYIFCNRFYKLYCKIFFRRDWQLTSNKLPRNVFVYRFLTKSSSRFPQDNGIVVMIFIMFITSCLRKSRHLQTFGNVTFEHGMGIPAHDEQIFVTLQTLIFADQSQANLFYLAQGCAIFFVGGPYNQLQTSSWATRKI